MKKIASAMFNKFFLFLFITFSSTYSAAQDFNAMFAKFKNDREVLRYGLEALDDGRTDAAYAAFEYGSARGHLSSTWKLAKMKQDGVGGTYDHIGAYHLFEKIAQEFFQKQPQIDKLPYVAYSVVALGDYSLNGIPNSNVKVNYSQAEFYYFRAASLYNDKDAQFKLANLYNSELLGAKRQLSAMRWYELACQQGHTMALMRLGEILFNGGAGDKNIIRGLAYLSFAARDENCTLCQKIYKKNYNKASATQRGQALQLVDELNIAKTSAIQNN